MAVKTTTIWIVPAILEMLERQGGYSLRTGDKLKWFVQKKNR